MKDKVIAIVAITGAFGSGKSTAASFLETRGFKKITLSSFLEEELRKKGQEITRKNLQDLGNNWRKENGSGILARKALEFIVSKGIKKAVIDGVRNLGEVEEFKNKSKFVLLGIVADRKRRFERVKKLKSRETLTWDIFNKLDFRDLGISEESLTGLQVAKCLAISDYFIDNNDKKNYMKKIEEVLRKI